MKKCITVFSAGVIFALILHFTPVMNRNNPLLPSYSLREYILIRMYSIPVQKCLTQKENRKVFLCVNDQMKTISKKSGAKVALAVIEPVSQGSPYILAFGHDLAHTIGNNALYSSYGVGAGIRNLTLDQLIQKMGRAIVDCDGWGSFGCYHGVIEVSLSRIQPEQRTAIIKKACLNNPLVMSKQFYLNQCMHWFGHAMAIFTDQTLLQTLAQCESVSKNFNSDEVQLCLSGVFHAGALPGTSDQGYLENVSRVYNPNDVYFPCRDVPERFKGHCFSHTTGRSHTSDLPVMMKNCDAIPETDPDKKREYVQSCYESIGNNLLINADFKAEGVAKKCDSYGAPDYAGFCYGGAARYAILRDPLLNNLIPFEVCSLARSADAKKTCYSLIGFANFENYKSKDVLMQFCSRIEPEYRTECSKWAPRTQ